jgi:CHAD domain-containing protein
MAFEFKVSEAVARGARRVVRKEIDKALAALAGGGTGPEEKAVHDARKRLKKVRAVLRLVRDGLGEKAYKRENAAYRDAARPLTEVRDARVLLDAFDGLAERFAEQAPADRFQEGRKELEARHREACDRVLREVTTFAQVSATLEAARDRIGDWPLRGGGRQALKGGLKRTYKSGRRAFAAAQAGPTDEDLHEWRKQAKYLRHQLELFEPAWSPALEELTRQAHDLGDRLGDDHDLAMLHRAVTEAPEKFGAGEAVEKLLALLELRRAELQKEAEALGRQAYGARPRELTRLVKGCWRAWRASAGVGSKSS